MGTLLATYAVAWAVVVAYVARLAIENNRLSRRLERLEESIGNEADRRASSQRLAG
jgi:CcmD family protein